MSAIAHPTSTVMASEVASDETTTATPKALRKSVCSTSARKKY